MPEEDGHEAWIRLRCSSEEYRQLAGPLAGAFSFCAWPALTESPIAKSMIGEWERARQSVLGSWPDARFIVVTRDESQPPEGWRCFWRDGQLRLHARDPRGALYGMFHLSRALQENWEPHRWEAFDAPKIGLRIINHWDNVYPSTDVERGYGGRSIFHWEELPAIRPTYHEYARLLASVGINAIILNNVNAGAPGHGGYRLLNPEWLPPLRALAEVFRGWGIQVGISIAYSSPVLLGDLDSDDPREPCVREWWQEKTAKIYEEIPDFLGFLVKADCEGQPGPKRHNLDHAEGSHVIAESLARHGGRLFWRAFVYDDGEELDLLAQPFRQFLPLDGKFLANTSLQIKYGPRDFQPREPAHPLLGALQNSATTLELQITQEYTGHDTHLVFLASLWEEIFAFPTQAGCSVADFLCSRPDSAIAGISNVVETPNWTSHLFGQANLFAFGRMAWDPTLSAADIAEDWTRRTFGDDSRVVEAVTSMLLSSHDIYCGYTAPFSLGQVFGNGSTWESDHFDPDPVTKNHGDLFCANEGGIGFDRTIGSRRGTLGQYCHAVQTKFGDPDSCPEPYLLWFHHLPWDHQLGDGRTLHEAILDAYAQSAEAVNKLITTWQSIHGLIDSARFEHVLERLHCQRLHARHWAEHMTTFINSISSTKPRYDLENCVAEHNSQTTV